MKIYLKPRTNDESFLLSVNKGQAGFDVLGSSDYRRVYVDLPGQIENTDETFGVSVELFVKPGCGIKSEDVAAATITLVPVKEAL